jgi:uncharacterized protein (TIGR03083 family)
MVDTEHHLAALRREGNLLTAAAEGANLDALVPTCPDWTVRELVRHIGGVHRWATSYVAGPLTEFVPRDLPEVVGTWPEDAELMAWFRAGHAALVEAISAAPPDLACYFFLPAPTPLAGWARRQAHETAIHRVDAELAAGRPVSSLSPELAADGIDELLYCSAPLVGKRLRLEPPRTLHVAPSDGTGTWLVHIGEGITVLRDHGPADCTITGPAESLCLLLWNRRGVDGLDVAGDASVLNWWRERVQMRWG